MDNVIELTKRFLHVRHQEGFVKAIESLEEKLKTVEAENARLILGSSGKSEKLHALEKIAEEAINHGINGGSWRESEYLKKIDELMEKNNV